MSAVQITADPGALRTWLIEYITSVLEIDPAALSTSATFDTVGIDSVEAVVMAGVMEEHFGVEVDPLWLLESPSIDTFVATHAGSASAVET